MTEELARALQSGKPPFHGTTLVVSDLGLVELWTCYSISARILVAMEVFDSYTENRDWHWHDGCVFQGGPISHQEWMSWLASPVNLAIAWRAEDYVHIGVNPPDLSWYLRFFLWEQPEEEDVGFGMDVSGDPALIERIRAAIEAECPDNMKVANSVTWFESTGDTWLPN